MRETIPLVVYPRVLLYLQVQFNSSVEKRDEELIIYEGIRDPSSWINDPAALWATLASFSPPPDPDAPSLRST